MPRLKLFREKLLPCIRRFCPGQDQAKLDSCFVGKEKHYLDRTDTSFPISDVVSTLGPYVNFFVSFSDADLDPAPRAPVRNAFDVMMLAQRTLSVPVVPSKTYKERCTLQQFGTTDGARESQTSWG